MKRSFFYHPLVKGFLLILCILSVMSCAMSGFRLIWMDMNNIFDSDTNIHPRYISSAALMWPSDYRMSGRIYSPDDEIWYSNYVAPYWYGDTYDNLTYDILTALITEIAAKQPMQITQNGSQVYPTELYDMLSQQFEKYTAEKSNLVFRVISIGSGRNGEDEVLISNMEDIAERQHAVVMQQIAQFTLVSEKNRQTSQDNDPQEGEAQTTYPEETSYPIMPNLSMDNGRKTALSDEKAHDDDKMDTSADTSPTDEKNYREREILYTWGVRASLTADDAYKTYYQACLNDSYHVKEWVYLTAGLAITACISLGLLLITAGIRRTEPGIHLSLIDRLPMEIPAAAKILLWALLLFGFMDFFAWNDAASCFALLYSYIPAASASLEMWLMLGAICGLALGIVLVTLWILCGFTRRVRAGHFWRNTIIYRLGSWFCRKIKWAAHLIAVFFRNLPLLWKWIVAFGFFCFWSLVTVSSGDGGPILIWFLLAAALGAAVCYIVWMIDRVKSATNNIANGHLDHHVNTQNMRGTPLVMAQNLNRIGDGMSHAVEERMKSERFRTELITNVSHDIKTPLTSIINYTDLLAKEEPENERMREYIDVLSRQSARLKKLIEDLLEASKASSGTLHVELAPTDAAELLSQAAGEYAERFQTANLTPVLSLPEDGARILADGRHLWRVFDNLMSNICKYSMPGTRVYLAVEKKNARVILSFRNISAAPLTVDAAELTERFVRGDASRHTEGSGLGLAIAKSLTELQKGTMTLFADGDLFKVIIEFSIYTD